ncbi:flavin reductase family protein [Geodermatophilus ruber]|uniref:NADH-FMN oxidoreductase RutF, flavin reductase (DIM6/NTAB) family n=1 Tax=Geodermatophilus ruber TaxID=504800 RepID=A0A1I4G7T6_9ACTN|nr:flavin reductase family protein [Geodermatophilus ruber]SFL25146.1 NADH-FMN oxidoreductase RutF, flavin reductase (DIM6/NTAB) family [Geodermatophilus ruber]
MSDAVVRPHDELDLSGAFRRSMSLLTAGVAVVTTSVGGRPWGMTITATCSVSAEPPMVLVSLAQTSVPARMIAEHGEYGLCLLGAHGIETAKFGAAPGMPKFLDEVGRVLPGAGRTPCVSGSIAHLDCAVVERVEAGDHVIYIGRVREIAFPSTGAPLLYGARQYQRTVPALQLATSESEDHALAYSAW